MNLEVTVEEPHTPDVLALLGRHLDFAHSTTPPELVFALDVDGLRDPSVTLCGIREPGGALLAVGALKRLDDGHAEIKSMHTVSEARRRGVGRVLLDHLLGIARDEGIRRVSLETGTGDAFAAARRLYEAVGFQRCEPFAGYPDDPQSTCMTVALEEEPRH